MCVPVFEVGCVYLNRSPSNSDCVFPVDFDEACVQMGEMRFVWNGNLQIFLMIGVVVVISNSVFFFSSFHPHNWGRTSHF